MSGWQLSLAVFCPVYKHMLTIVDNEKSHKQEKPLSLSEYSMMLIRGYVKILTCPLYLVSCITYAQRWLLLLWFSNCKTILLSWNKLFSEGGNFANSFQRPILCVFDQTLSYQLESSMTLFIGRLFMMCWVWSLIGWSMGQTSSTARFAWHRWTDCLYAGSSACLGKWDAS